jgi:uncharacterized protein YbjT (DUF2867 family)
VAILVTGATGMIGSALLGRLHAEGRDAIAVVRALNEDARRLSAPLVVLDIAQAMRPEDWLAHLQGVDAVVNCAGVLQDSPRDSTVGVHVRGASALFEACTRLHVRRVVHLSAIGADRDALTQFGATKQGGEQALMQQNLDWIVLRPTVVVGRPAYGGSALFRGLAALPILPVMPDTGPLQIVQLDDVIATILFFLRPEASARVAIDLAGPDRLSMTEVVAAYRQWLGWKPARLLRVPRLLARVLYACGDVAGLLGWRPPVRSTARHEMTRGAIGDPTAWRQITSIKPQPLGEALRMAPASVQERWFASLYMIKPLAFVIFPAFWVLTGIISLGPGYEIGKNLMLEGGAGLLSGPSVVAGAVADILIGVTIAYRRTTRVGLYAALAISIFYFATGSILVPRLWEEPLGPLMKIWPILCLNLMMLAVLRER